MFDEAPDYNWYAWCTLSHQRVYPPYVWASGVYRNLDRVDGELFEKTPEQLFGSILASRLMRFYARPENTGWHYCDPPEGIFHVLNSGPTQPVVNWKENGF